jgi:hypothetical protein
LEHFLYRFRRQTKAAQEERGSAFMIAPIMKGLDL